MLPLAVNNGWDARNHLVSAKEPLEHKSRILSIELDTDRVNILQIEKTVDLKH